MTHRVPHQLGTTRHRMDADAFGTARSGPITSPRIRVRPRPARGPRSLDSWCRRGVPSRTGRDTQARLTDAYQNRPRQRRIWWSPMAPACCCRHRRASRGPDRRIGDARFIGFARRCAGCCAPRLHGYGHCAAGDRHSDRDLYPFHVRSATRTVHGRQPFSSAAFCGPKQRRGTGCRWQGLSDRPGSVASRRIACNAGN